MDNEIGVNSGFHPETRVRMADGNNKSIKDVEIGEQLCGDNNEFRTVTNKVSGFGQLVHVNQSKAIGYMITLYHILILKATGVTPYVGTYGLAYAVFYYTRCRDNSCKKASCSKRGFKKTRIPCPTREIGDTILNKLTSGTLDPYYVCNGEIFEMSVRDFNNMCSDYIKNTKLKGYKSIPKIIYQETTLPIDPYLLGLWLGDGTTGKAEITSADKEIEDYLYHYIERYNGSMRIGKNTRPVGTISSAGVSTKECSLYRFVWNVQRKCPIKNALRDLGILYNKHIPAIYLNSSVENRMQLLAGLLDTDGCLIKFADTYSYSFTQTEKRKLLIDQLKEMCKCLGFTNCNLYKRTCGPVNRETFKDGTKLHNRYDLVISGPMILKVPCLIHRKKAYIQCPDQRFLSPNASTIRISQVDEVNIEYIRLSINGNQHFLLEDLTVVHS